jgi:hypothetical protein
LIRVILDLLEEPVHDAQVVVVVGIEARAEAMEKAHGTHGIGLVGQGEVALQVFPDDAMQRGGLGAASTVGLGMGAGRWPGWWCGPPGFSLSGMGLCGHRRPLASRGESRSVSTTRRANAWGGGMGERVPPQESWAWRRPWRQRIIPTPSWIQPHGEFGLKRAPGGGYDERNY